MTWNVDFVLYKLLLIYAKRCELGWIYTKIVVSQDGLPCDNYHQTSSFLGELLLRLPWLLRRDVISDMTAARTRFVSVQWWSQVSTWRACPLAFLWRAGTSGLQHMSCLPLKQRRIFSSDRRFVFISYVRVEKLSSRARRRVLIRDPAAELILLT